MQALRKRTATDSNIKNLVAISESTVKRRLKDSNLLSRRHVKGPLLIAVHRRQRLRFARKHQSWTEEDWENVLKSPDDRDRVWKSPGERYSQCCES